MTEQELPSASDRREQEFIDNARVLGKMIEPGPGRIAVQVNDLKLKTDTGIVLLPNAQRGDFKPTKGVVVAVAPEGTDDLGEEFKPYFEVGDHVLFGKFSGVEINYGRERVILMTEREILCKLKDPNLNIKVR